jgi:hypothetical protein
MLMHLLNSWPPMPPCGIQSEARRTAGRIFAHGLQRYPDLVLEPTGEYWARPDGIALQWVMSATVMDDSKGAEHKGKKWIVEGLSFIQFDGLTVVLEADYHEGTSRDKSLHEGGLHAPIRR